MTWILGNHYPFLIDFLRLSERRKVFKLKSIEGEKNSFLVGHSIHPLEIKVKINLYLLRDSILEYGSSKN